MEKIVQLDQRELQQTQVIEQQRVQALANIGLITINEKDLKAQMVAAEKALEASNESHRAFMRQVLVERGITRYDTVRAVPGGLSVGIPDAVEPPPAPASSPEQKVNGAAQPEV
jgi:hypothetical protein